MKISKFFGFSLMVCTFALVGCNNSNGSEQEPVSSQPAPSSVVVSSVSTVSSQPAPSSVAPSSAAAPSSAQGQAVTISLEWTNAVTQGFSDESGKTIKGGYITWNLTSVVAGTYEFRAFAKQGSGADSKTLATRCYKFVINNGAEIDPTNNDKTPTEMGVTSASSFTEGMFSNLTLPAGDVALKFGTTAESDYRLTFDLTQPAKLVKIA